MVDHIDLKILKILQKDARRTFMSISREINVPVNIVNSRFKKMKESGLIRGTTIKINFSKVGYSHMAALRIKTISSKSDEVVDYISNLQTKNGLKFIYKTVGFWSIVTVLLLKNIFELHKIKRKIQHHPAVIEVNESINEETDFLYDKMSLEHLIEK